MGITRSAYTRFSVTKEPDKDGDLVTTLWGSNRGYESIRVMNSECRLYREAERKLADRPEFASIVETLRLDLRKRFPALFKDGSLKELDEEDIRHYCHEMMLERFAERPSEFQVMDVLSIWNNWRVEFRHLSQAERGLLRSLIFYPEKETLMTTKILCKSKDHHQEQRYTLRGFQENDDFDAFERALFNCGSLALLDMMNRSVRGKIVVMTYYWNTTGMTVDFSSAPEYSEELDLTHYGNLIPKAVLKHPAFLREYKEIEDYFVESDMVECNSSDFLLRQTWKRLINRQSDETLQN